MTDWEALMHQNDYDRFVSEFEPAVISAVSYDLGGSGVYLDDDIGGADFLSDVGEVVEPMLKSMYDNYCDTIGDTVTEILGSVFLNTI
jgi:hypothetical protein